MQQGVTVPVRPVVAIAAATLALAVLLQLQTPSQRVVRLVLHAPVEAHAVYLTAWRDGDVHVTLDRGALHQINFKLRATGSDGCQWLGKETLVPINARSYRYSYDETILSCRCGARPARKTPRTGIVTIED